MLRFGHSTSYRAIHSYHLSPFQAFSGFPSFSSFSTWDDDGDYDYSSYLHHPYNFSSHPHLFGFTYDFAEDAEIIFSRSLTLTSATI